MTKKQTLILQENPTMIRSAQTQLIETLGSMISFTLALFVQQYYVCGSIYTYRSLQRTMQILMYWFLRVYHMCYQ